LTTYYRDYKLIEQGFKHTTVQETVEGLVWGAISAIAMEIATAGIAKFVRIGRVLEWAARGRAGRFLIDRYNELSGAAKGGLERLRTSRPVRTQADEVADGDNTIPSTTGTSQVDEVCRLC